MCLHGALDRRIGDGGFGFDVDAVQRQDAIHFADTLHFAGGDHAGPLVEQCPYVFRFGHVSAK